MKKDDAWIEFKAFLKRAFWPFKESYLTNSGENDG